MEALTVNPTRLSAPMGAMLAFLGVKHCMPLIHGAQGCASFSKVFFTRHFHDPIPVQTTALSDISAVLGGGDEIVTEAIGNILAKVTPDLVGLISTGLTETKGDDLRSIAAALTQKSVWVSTPDYIGGLQSGWAAATEALITQLVQPCMSVTQKVAILPHASMTPIEVEDLKALVESFGFEAVALPDLSESMDGHLGEKQATMTQGGVSIQAISQLGESCAVVAIGRSMLSAARLLAAKNPAMKTIALDHIGGLGATDRLIGELMALSSDDRSDRAVPASVKRWRARLQDMLLDSHFTLGKARIVLALEADQAVSIAALLSEAGAKCTLITPTDEGGYEKSSLSPFRVGDLWDVEQIKEPWDLIICGSHGEALAHRMGRKHLEMGFPQWERLGGQLESAQLYHGSARFLATVANKIAH